MRLENPHVSIQSTFSLVDQIEQVQKLVLVFLNASQPIKNENGKHP